jgi:hypothetical protein
MDEIVKALPVIVPLIVLELGLMIFALVDVVRRKMVRGGSKVPWIILIVLVQIIGPLVYLFAGRKEEIIDRDQD